MPEPKLNAPLTAAIAEAERPFLELIAHLEGQIREARGVLARIREGQTGPQTPSSAHSEFHGLTRLQAFHKYMLSLNGQKVQLDQAIAYLLAQGVWPGKQRGQQTPEQTMKNNLTIALTQSGIKNAVYDYLPKGSLEKVSAREITVWMIESKKKKP